MSLLYIPVSSVAVAAALSQGLVALSKPPGFRPPDYGMTDYFGYREHPQSGAVVVEIDPELPVYVHAEADPTELLEIVAQRAPEAELLAMQQAVTALKSAGGGTVPLGAFVPADMASEAFSYDQLDADGWSPAIDS